MASTVTTSRDHLPTIDGWRAVAILLVVTSHLARFLPEKSDPLFAVIRLILGKGALGVPLFFSISGLLITGRLIADFRSNQRVRLKNFYLKRAGRILPPALTFLFTIGLLDYWQIIQVRNYEILGSLLFVRNYVGHGWVTGHFWSLAVEEHFYLLWPLAFSLLYPKRRYSAFLAAAGFFAIWRYLALTTGFSIPFLPKSYYGTDVNLVGLLWGAFLAVEREHLNWRWLEFRQRPLGFASILALCLASAWARFPFGELVFPLSCALLISATPRYSPSGLPFRFLNSRVMQTIGKRSYGLYVWQQLAFVPILNSTALPSFTEGIVRFLALAAVVELSFRFLEKPIVHWVRRRTELDEVAISARAA